MKGKIAVAALAVLLVGACASNYGGAVPRDERATIYVPIGVVVRSINGESVRFRSGTIRLPHGEYKISADFRLEGERHTNRVVEKTLEPGGKYEFLFGSGMLILVPRE